MERRSLDVTARRAFGWALRFRRELRGLGKDTFDRLRGKTNRATALIGPLRGGPEVVRALYLGRTFAVNGINAAFFQSQATIEDRGPLGRGDRSPTDAAAFDMVIREAWPWERTKSLDDVVVATWVDSVSEPGRDYEQYLANQVAASTRRYVKKVRSSDFRIVVSSARSDYEFFYHEMQLPLVNSRYGDGVDMASLEAFVRWNGRSFATETIFLERAGERIAGMGLLVPRLYGSMRVWAYGALPKVIEDKALRRDFTLALNSYAFERACCEGVKISLGNCRPFMDDGVLLYKRHWGCRPALSRGMVRFCVSIRPDRRHAVLSRAPLLHFGRDRICGFCAFTPTEPDPVRQLVAQLRSQVYPDLGPVTVVAKASAEDRAAWSTAVSAQLGHEITVVDGGPP